MKDTTRSKYAAQRKWSAGLGWLGLVFVIAAILLRIFIVHEILAVAVFAAVFFMGLMLLFAGWFTHPGSDEV